MGPLNGLLICCSYLDPAEGASSYNFDIAKKSDLTRLYNSKVYKAERMRRPLGILGTTIGPISHTGFVFFPQFQKRLPVAYSLVHRNGYQRVYCHREKGIIHS